VLYPQVVDLNDEIESDTQSIISNRSQIADLDWEYEENQTDEANGKWKTKTRRINCRE